MPNSCSLLILHVHSVRFVPNASGRPGANSIILSSLETVCSAIVNQFEDKGRDRSRIGVRHEAISNSKNRTGRFKRSRKSTRSAVGYQTLTALPGDAQNAPINYSQSCPIPNSILQSSAYNKLAHEITRCQSMWMSALNAS